MDPEAVNLVMKLCIRWEGFSAAPYLCPAGVPTIGYGFTTYPDGRKVTLRDPSIGEPHARMMLRWFIVNKYMPQALGLCPQLDSPGRIAAITDFVFNLGPGRLRASTLRKRIKAGRWDEVPEQLRRWTYAGGRKLTGLVRRREAEIALL
jgi:lysozyme